jgi:hypothetical protein
MSETTTAPAVEIARGDLVLVTLTPDYARSYSGPVVLRDKESAEDERTFYATRHDDERSQDYLTLVVPESDPRSRDMWPVDPTRYGLELESPHKGWDVLKSNVTPVPSAPSQETTDAPVTYSQADVDRMLEQARQEERRAAAARFEAWKESASEIACQYADDNSLCGEFERCMEEIGLQGRARPHVVVLRVPVDARDGSRAVEEAVEMLSGESSYFVRSYVSDVEDEDGDEVSW